MMPFRYFLLFLSFFSLNIFAQYKVSSYQESGNTIKFNLAPDAVPLATLTDDIRTKMRSYYDESRPGELALPTRSVFVAIPPDAKIKVSYVIKDRSIENFNPSLNPEASLSKDTTIDLNFELRAIPISNSKEPVEILGYFEMKGVRIVHLKLHQFNYNISSAKLETIKNIEISLQSDKPLINYNSGIKFSETTVQLFKGMLVNPGDAIKYASTVQASDTTGNWIDYTASYVKLGVAKDGIYRVFGSDLQALGVNLAEIQPATLQLLKKGKQQPIFVNNGSDNSFDTGDYIEFLGERNMGDPNYRIPNAYGEPYNEYFDRFTDTTIYWVTWNRGAGDRVTTAPQTLGVASDTLKFYHELVHQEQDRSYLNFDANLARRDLPYFYENKTFYWQNINAPTTVANRSFTFSLNELSQFDSVRFFSRIASGAATSATGSHNLALQIGSLYPSYDSTFLDRYERIVLKGSAPVGLFTNGNNTLKVLSYPTGNSINTVWIDWVQMEYPRNLKATSDSIVFRFPYNADNSVKYVQLSNLTSDSLMLWKKGRTLKKIFSQRSGSFLVIQDTVKTEDRYFLVKNSGVLKPVIYYKKNWKNFRNSQNKADYLAVTIPAFSQPVKQHLGYLKTAHSLDTMLVDINDVYDEYSFGYFSIEALREFFRTTQTVWQTPHPDYAMLIGSAGYDYRLTYSSALGILNKKKNIVPSYGSPLSDNLLAVFDSTSSYIPQILMGRVPAKSIDDVNRYFGKLSTYYNQKYDRFNKRVLLLSGGVDDTQALEFKNQNTVLGSMFGAQPYSFAYDQFYRTFAPTFSNYGPFPLEEVDASIKKGSVILSYVGHSGTFHWDNDIRTPSQLLNNANKGSILTDFGCSTGKFGEPDVDCFAEQFLLYPTGQPISYISNASLGFTSTASVAPFLFYRAILEDSLWRPSEALRSAKTTLFQQYGSGLTNQLFAMTNTYFGDPFLELKIPPKPNFIYDGESITITPKNPDDQVDTLTLSLNYFNYGSVVSDTLSIKITDQLNGIAVFDTIVRRPVPNFKDSLIVRVPIKNRLGAHSIKAILNYDGRINEIYNDDNEASTSFIVSSSSSRDNLKYSTENSIKDFLYFINPQRKPAIESLTLRISDNLTMSGATELTVPYDSFFTKVSLSSFQQNKRYYFRVKDNITGEFGLVRSFFLTNKNGFGLTDSVTFSSQTINNIGYSNGKFALQDKSVRLHVEAAGYYDGNFAIIYHNGNNALVSNTVLSHNVAVFNAANMEFLYAQSYNLTYGDVVGDRAMYKALLDSLDESKIIVVAAAHDPYTGTDAELRAKLKSYGSRYIDSVRVRDSWFMVGRKNAAVGSIPEGWKKANFGAVSFDSVYVFSTTSGSFITNNIGPVSSWERLEVSTTVPDSARLNFRVVGTTSGGVTDTTSYLAGSGGVYDLSQLNSRNYNTIRLLGELESLDKKSSPQISGLYVTYKDFTEVGTNYQSVSLSADTVLPNRDVQLRFKVTNGSNTDAKNFKVKVESRIGNGTPSKFFEQTIDSLGGFSSKAFNVTFRAPVDIGTGELIITIDPDNVLKEFYRDNNTYSVPVNIKGDTTKPYLTLSVDGSDVPDGEYINPKSNFKIDLYDFSSIPLQDTTTISIKLNGSPVFFNSAGVSYSFSNTNPKVTVNYKPGFQDGDYELNIVARGNSSSFADTAKIEKRFSVMNEAKLLNVYNYPNPFVNETWFTFKLTQIPEELRIVVYTVAGRKIKEVNVPVSQLKYDLNKIYWDGRDEDGDLIANGVYLYRVIMKKGDKTEKITEKLAVVR